MKILIACARRHLVLFKPSCLRSRLAPQWWKGDHHVLLSFQSPTVVQWGSGQTPRLNRCLGNAAMSQRDPELQSSLESSEKFTLIYQLSGIRLLKVFSRLKVLQTGITLAILPPVWYFHWQNQVTFTQGLYITGLLSFSLVFLYAISFFLQRVIGLMYLNENGALLKVSHLTFWGKRRNFCCPVESVVTLGDENEEKNKFFLKFRQYDQTEVFYFSLHFGQVVDQKGFGKVFRRFS